MRYFRKSDRNSAVAAIFIAIVGIILFTQFPLSEQELEQKKAKGKARKTQYYAQPEAGKRSLFYFDPNTADSTQLLQLGLQPWQVRSIYRYRSKGGIYHTPEDFAQLYGLTLEKYNELRPYIRIKPIAMARDYIKRSKKGYDDHHPSGSYSDDNRQGYASKSRQTSVEGSSQGNGEGYRNNGNRNQGNDRRYQTDSNGERITKIRYGETIDINTADTNLLKRIPGIGSYYSRRIVELRHRYGGFTSVEQLLAIRNFPETALEYMTVSDKFPDIHINSMSLKELQSHPMLNYQQASDIIKLRRLSSKITSIQQLSFITSISPELLKRLTRHIKFD